MVLSNRLISFTYGLRVMIERIHLMILSKVDSKGSLTAAAESLNLTQPALSHSIKKLEQQANVQLWVKEGRSLRLTKAGQHVLSAANRILPQLQHLDEVLRQYSTGEQGSLRIGMECHPCYRWLLKVVEPFLKQWPGVDIDIKQRFQFGGMAALFNHDIDILVTPDPLEKKGVSFSPVFDYEQVLVVGIDHKLANKAFVLPKDLSDQTLYTYPVDIERLDIYTEFLMPSNRSPKRRKEVEATEMILQLVAAGRGVATLPKWLVEEHSKTLPIKYLRLGEKGISKQIHLGMRDGGDINSYTQAFYRLSTEVDKNK